MTNNTTHTSLELSKKLKDNGCELESEMVIIDERLGGVLVPKGSIYDGYPRPLYPAYDILNEICVKHVSEFFGWGWIDSAGEKDITEMILMRLQDEAKQEAEELIWDNCLFNPKKGGYINEKKKQE